MAYIKCPGCNRDVDQNKYEDMLKKKINKKIEPIKVKIRILSMKQRMYM